MKQERVAPPRRKKTAAPEIEEDVPVQDPDPDLLTDIDELLDEIDAVLEDQAVLFEYRQRSGQ